MRFGAGFGEFFLFWALFIAATAVVHVCFTLAVIIDANKIKHKTKLAPTWLWALATLIGGPLVGGMYWLVNHMSGIRDDGAL